jgi:hypothetical protein
MKFALLKSLNPPGVLSENWTNSVQQSYNTDPSGLVKDYEKLVRAIADLELMESYIRKNILHKDGSTSYALDIMGLVRDNVALIAPWLTVLDSVAGLTRGRILSLPPK